MTSRRLPTGLLAVATALSISACGASLDAQTYQERNNAESSNTAVGQLAIRDVAVTPPRTDEGYAVGDDAIVKITVTNAGTEEDRLVEVTSSAAREVVVLAGDQEGDLVAPPLGSTGSFVTFELRGLTRALRPGEYVDLSLRFAANGTSNLLVPVMTTGKTDRPVYTGERFEGGEEPALQAPAGGHHGEEHEGEEHEGEEHEGEEHEGEEHEGEEHEGEDDAPEGSTATVQG